MTLLSDEIVLQFIGKVCDSFDNIDKPDLENMLLGKIISSPKKDVPFLDKNIIYESNVNTLRSFCRQYNLKSSGKKQQLINRLLNREEDTEIEEISLPKKVKKKPNKIKTTPKVLEQLQSKSNIRRLYRNEYGNMWDPETKFIFDIGSKSVKGVQIDNGDTRTLCPEDIEECKRYNFKYILPDNLDAGIAIDDNVNIDSELEDDESDDEDGNEYISKVIEEHDSDDEYESGNEDDQYED